jgi:hypothetical protein
MVLKNKQQQRERERERENLNFELRYELAREETAVCSG